MFDMKILHTHVNGNVHNWSCVLNEYTTKGLLAADESLFNNSLRLHFSLSHIRYTDRSQGHTVTKIEMSLICDSNKCEIF